MAQTANSRHSQTSQIGADAVNVVPKASYAAMQQLALCVSGFKLLDYLLLAPFRDAPFIPNHDTQLFPVNLFICGMFQTRVF